MLRCNYRVARLEEEYVGNVPKKLKDYTLKFVKFFCQCYSVVNYCLPQLCHLPNFIGELIEFVESFCNFSSMCSEHSITLKRTVINTYTMLCAYSWAYGVNPFSGKHLKQ